MELYQLNPKHKNKSRKRVGRGGKKGTYSGRGMKGQKSRAGKKPRVGFAGGDTTIVKRMPKKRGSVGKVKIRKGQKLGRSQIKPVNLSLKDIEDNFEKGEIVSPKTLFQKGMVVKIRNRIPRIKILDKGELKKKLEFRKIGFSKEVRKKLGLKEKKVSKKK
ncbi:uL15 family ribosomal protein [Patescibacteria group bacterium]|nr:uL15 family ribosomal protein [Patescibacteria group bacterium]